MSRFAERPRASFQHKEYTPLEEHGSRQRIIIKQLLDTVLLKAVLVRGVRQNSIHGLVVRSGATSPYPTADLAGQAANRCKDR